MRYFYFSFFFTLLLFNHSSFAQNFLEGHIYDEVSKLPIEGAIIKIGDKTGISQENGYYKINNIDGFKEGKVFHLAFDTLKFIVPIDKSRNFNLHLNPLAKLMDEILIVNENDKSSFKRTAGLQIFNKKDLASSPGFLGQKDPIRLIQSLPGIGKGGDGNSGIYIRGGSSGQNLTLFNEAVIYNPSHLLGLFSVFNSSVVDEVKLFKSGVPANQFGRLSSLIEVNSSKKIVDTLKFEGDISPFSLNTSAYIPMAKNWSVGLFARKTFMNQTIWPIMNQLNNGSFFNKMNYDFYDLNLISNLKIGKKDFLYLSAFTGGDDFGFRIANFGIRNGMDWNNTALSLHWKRNLSNNLILHSITSLSSYRFNFEMSQDQYLASIQSRIRDYNLKSYMELHSGKHQLKIGVQHIKHKFTPNTPYVNSSGTNLDYGTANIYYADENAIFLLDEINLLDVFQIHTGLRLNYFRHTGPYIKFSDDQSEFNVPRNKTVSDYLFLEPSFSLNYLVNKFSSIKLAFSRNVQPIHLISVTAVNFPTDFWMPSVGDIRPSRGYQTSLGFFKDLRKNKYHAYIDVFYKKMDGLVEFSGGILNLLDNLKIEDNLLSGNGNAFGAEFFIKKSTGKLTGWLGYTLSKSNRFFNGLNNGESFPFKYDRRHDFSITTNYQINSKWNMAALFTYATGNAFTMPTSRYTIGGSIINEYGPFNAARMPAYHRLDLATTYKLKSYSRFDTELSFSIYNLYNRQNPIYSFFMAQGNLDNYEVSIQPKSVALLPILPSINYKVKFK